MGEAQSLTDFKEMYEKWDLVEFYKLLTIKMAVKCNKIAENKFKYKDNKLWLKTK